MDPQASIDEAVRLSRSLLAAFDRDEELDDLDAARLAELLLSVVEWLSRSGLSPSWTDALRQP